MLAPRKQAVFVQVRQIQLTTRAMLIVRIKIVMDEARAVGAIVDKDKSRLSTIDRLIRF